jgi:predicted  nucleic acid-binding Zn-ribbon protein
MSESLQSLVRLQAIEFQEIKDKDALASIAELRNKIPLPILGRYDRLVAHGKKGAALVRDQVCTGCHMRLPMAVIMSLRHGHDFQLCDSCGRYLYLADPVDVQVQAPAPRPKPAKKSRKSEAPLYAV